MSGRDLWGTDDPNRVDPPDDDYSDDPTGLNHEPDPDYDEWREGASGPAKEWDALQNDLQKAGLYEGSLIDDCKSIMELGEQLKAKMAEPEPEDVFAAAKRRDAEEAALALAMSQMYAGLKKTYN